MSVYPEIHEQRTVLRPEIREQQLKIRPRIPLYNCTIGSYCFSGYPIFGKGKLTYTWVPAVSVPPEYRVIRYLP